MSSAKKTVKILPHLADQIDLLIKEGDYSSRANFVEDAVRRRLEELCTPPNQLTVDDMHMLFAVAQDYHRIYENFEEDGVRSFLKQHYASDSNWPEWKIELGVLFICSQPWKKWN